MTVVDGVGVVAEEKGEISAAGFDVLMDGEGFGDGPAEAGLFYQVLVVADGLEGPGFAVGDVVEGGEDGLGTGLAEVGEGDGVGGAEPAEGFFERRHKT